MKRNYFIEKEFIRNLNEYKKNKSKASEDYLVKDLSALVGAVINKYGFYKYENEEIDDLKQQAFTECWKTLERFDTERGSAFNFFTKVTRLSLMSYTTKRQKHRGIDDINEYSETIKTKRTSENLFDFGKDFFDKAFSIIVEEINEEYKEKIKEEQENYNKNIEKQKDFFNEKIKRFKKISNFIYNFNKENIVFKLSDLKKEARKVGINTNELSYFIKTIKLNKGK